ncbi:MAG: hypothetical protein ACI93S_000430 [Ancylomarina sp.]|jgi:hypothetical protein
MSFRILYTFVLLICFSFLISCKKSTQNGNKSETEITQNKEKTNREQSYSKFAFTKEMHKFGEISEGEIGICEFYFRNVGNTNLIIKSIESSCGCTVVKWKKKPIKVGEESKITVEFNSKGRHGKQYKVLTIFANTKRKVKELIITATVK